MDSSSGFSIIRRLLRDHIRPYRHTVVFAVICMVIIAVSIATNTWMMQPALDMIFIEKDRTMLTIIPLALLIISLIGASAHYGNSLSMHFLSQRIIADMQIRLFDHLMKSDMGLFHEEASGRLISRFTNDITLMRNAFVNTLTSLAKNSLSVVFLIGVMFYHNTSLALLALSVFPVAFYPLVLLGKKMRRYAKSAQYQLADFTVTLDEVFKGAHTVKSYNREAYESRRARLNIEKLFGFYHKAAKVQAAANPMMEILGTVSMVLVIWYGGYQVLEEQITPGAFFSFVAAFFMAYKPVRSIAGLGTILQEGIAAAARYYGVLDMPPTIADMPEATPLHVTQGAIAFNHVRFIYPSSGRGVHDVTLDIPAGKKVALVGFSGGGKSTLMNVLMRLYDIQSGSITIDGQDIRKATLHSLRESMAYVPQDATLFDDTVYANIAYGCEKASYEDVLRAAKNAHADEFIQHMPEGYETMIGAHGIRLSGGQRQRISIARAMLKNAPILLLDEATSSLDNESERMIQEALGRLMQGRTTLVIAHRLSTIVNADIIYVIDSGCAVECGSHTELVARRGVYHRLYSEHLYEVA